MEERRATPRQRTLKGARIVINDGFSTIDCLVRNLSRAGAKLKLASTVGIPDRFDLVFDDGRKFDCTVIWRQAEELGVTFAGDRTP